MLPWIGGKYRQATWIYETAIRGLVKNGHIKTYVEPFGGAFWTYLRTDIYKYVDNIVYNDKNKFLVNLFYTVKNKRNELLEAVKDMKPANNIEFDKCKEIVFKKAAGDYEIGNIEVAKSYAYAQLHAYNGNKITQGMKPAKDKKKFRSFIRKLDGTTRSVKNFIEKMNNITSINNKDYKEVIKENDSKETLFYVDPPYFNKERFYGFNDFNRKEHVELANILKSIKGKFILSYYYFDGIEELYPRDKFYYFSKEFTKTSSKYGNKGTEIIITNFNPDDYEVKPVNNVNYKSKSVNNINYKRDVEIVKIGTFNFDRSLIKNIIDNNNIDITPVNNVNYEPNLKVKVVNTDNKIYKIYKNYLLNNINKISIKLNEVLNDNLYTPNSPNVYIS